MSTYYTSKYSGEEIDERLDSVSVLGGATTPQGALANLGAGVRPGLLVNGDFRAGHVVNQRGQTSYTNVANHQYCIDRWFSASAWGTVPLNVSLLNDGLKISSINNQESPNAFGILWETVPELAYLVGRTVTLSVKVKDVEANSDGVYPYIGYQTRQGEYLLFNPKAINVAGVFSVEFVVQSGRDSVGIGLEAGSTEGASITIEEIKLEVGQGQTLAYQDDTGAWQLLPQPESDYATQLAKCQRYLQLSIVGDYRASYISANSIVFVVPTPVTMRVSPTIIGDFLVKTIDGSMQTGFTFAAQKMSNHIIVTATKTAHGILDAMLSIQSNTDGFTAEL